MPIQTPAAIPPAGFADILSTVSGLSFALIGCLIRAASAKAPPWNSVPLIVADLLRGGAFFPFVLLSLSVADSRFLRVLVEADRVVLTLSGIIASLYVLGEFIRAAQGKSYVYERPT